MDFGGLLSWEEENSTAKFGTKIASQNRSDHGGHKQARSRSAAEIARFFASAATEKLLAAGDFLGYPRNRRKLAETMAASRRSRAISRPQRPRDTKCKDLPLKNGFACTQD